MTTNVFIVDDSATARTALRLILETSIDINVIGVASNPLIALKRMHNHWPDVIISDIEMPEMDGFEFLKYLNRNHPTPFIVFSNHTGSSAASSVEALSRGAVEIIPKPNFALAESLEQTSANILNAIRAAATMELKHVSYDRDSSESQREKLTTAHSSNVGTPSSTSIFSSVPAPRVRAPLADSFVSPLTRTSFGIIAIGSSTGGTTIIEKILTQMKLDSPGVVIVQHMPELFTKAFANRINQFCEIYVKEAEDGDQVLPGTALIAPGGKHMRLVRRNLAGFGVTVFDDDYVNRHKPSVDVLFSSVAEVARKDALGVILTGMGKDGAKGLLSMKQAGAETIAQSAEDCAVYGMPKAAKALDAVDHDLTSEEIASAISTLKTRL